MQPAIALGIEGTKARSAQALRELHGAADLLTAAVGATARLVRDTHASASRAVFGAIACVPPLRPAGHAVEQAERAISGLVYGSIAALTAAADVVVDTCAALHRESEEDASTARWPSAVGILNGAVGD